MISAASASSGSLRRPVITTFAPAATNASVIALPIPVPPPVTNATLPCVLALADRGVARALLDDAHLREGLNVHRGQVTHAAVAASLGLDHQPANAALKPRWTHPDDA